MLLPAFPKDRQEEEYSCDDLQAVYNETGLYTAVGEAGAEREGWMKAVVTCSRWETEINYWPK